MTGNKKSIWGICSMALVLLGVNCTKNTPTEPKPESILDVSQTSLDFGTTNTDMELNITNKGQGTLEWKVSTDKDRIFTD